jgi:riboflavin biosynthesis pyrimidine reductase
MVSSIDGRIDVAGWPADAPYRGEYEAIHAQYGAGAWMCGRVTMEAFAAGVRTSLPEREDRAASVSGDLYVAPGRHESYAVAVDTRGELLWTSNAIGGDHLIVVVSRLAPTAHLQALRTQDISFIVAGEDAIDFPLALMQLAEHFGVQSLMLEGGGQVNRAMLEAGLVDEVSLLLAPVIDGRAGAPSVFDGMSQAPVPLVLQAVETLPTGVAWLRWAVRMA